MEFKKKILGSKTPHTGKWRLLKAKTDQMLFGNMADHLGCILSPEYNSWAWNHSAVHCFENGAGSFAVELEKKVGLEYANWFRSEVGLPASSGTSASEYSIQFENLHVEFKIKADGVYPIIHTQTTELGRWLKANKQTVSGLTIKVENTPEVLIKTLYLGGVDSDGKLIKKSHATSDLSSKSPKERIVIVQKFLSALKTLGEVHSSKFGRFIKLSNGSAESPKMSNTEFIEFEHFRMEAVFTDSKVKLKVSKKSAGITKHFAEQDRTYDGWRFSSSACPELRMTYKKLFLHGSSTVKEYDISSEYRPRLVSAFIALVAYGKTIPALMGGFVGSSIPGLGASVATLAAPPSSDKMEVRFERFCMEALFGGDNVTLSVPYTTEAINKHFYHKQRHAGFTFETARYPELKVDENFLFLNGSDSSGSNRTMSKEWPVSEGYRVKLAEAFAKLTEYALTQPSLFGPKVDAPVAPAAEAATTDILYFFETANFHIQVKKHENMYTLIYPKQSASVGTHLWQARTFGRSRFETYSHIRFEATGRYLRGRPCRGNGEHHGSNNETIRLTDGEASVLREVLADFLSYAKSKPDIFGAVISTNLETSPVPVAVLSPATATDGTWQEFESENLHIKTTMDGTKSTSTVYRQSERLYSFRKTVNSFDIRSMNLPEVAGHEFFLDGDRNAARAFPNSYTSGRCSGVPNIRAAYQALHQAAVENPDIFGKIIKSTASPVIKETPVTPDTINVKFERLELTASFISDTQVRISVNKQTPAVGRFFWTQKNHCAWSFETYSELGLLIPDKKLYLAGTDSQGELRRDLPESRDFPCSVSQRSEVADCLKALVSIGKANSATFGRHIKETSGAASASVTASVPAAEYLPYVVHFQNLRVEMEQQPAKVLTRILVQTPEVTAFFKGPGKSFNSNGWAYHSVGHIEFCTTSKILFVKGAKTETEHYDNRKDSVPKIIEALSGLRYVAEANPDVFGPIVFSNIPAFVPVEKPTETAAAVIPAASTPVIPTPVLKNALIFENLHIEMEIDGSDVKTHIHNQSSGVTSWAEANDDTKHHGWYIRSRACIQFRDDNILYLNGSSTTTRRTSTDSGTHQKMLECLTVLKKVGLSNSSVFGPLLLERIETVVPDLVTPIVAASITPAIPVSTDGTEGMLPNYVVFEKFVFSYDDSAGLTFKIGKQEPSIREWAQATDGVLKHGWYIRDRGTLALSSDNKRPVLYLKGTEDLLDSSYTIVQEHFKKAPNLIETLVKVGRENPAAFGRFIKSSVVPKTLTAEEAAPCSEIIMTESVLAPVEAAPEPSKVLALGMTMFEFNKTATIIESKRQLGKTILGQAETKLAPHMPEIMQPMLKSPIGKLLVANSVIVATDFYTGEHKEKLEVLNESLLSAAASDAGDWLNVNSIIDGIISSVKGLR